MFWNWASAAQRRYLAIRAEKASDTIRVAFDQHALDGAPAELTAALLRATQELAVVAPADLEAAVERAEKLVERLQAYRRSRAAGAPATPSRSS